MKPSCPLRACLAAVLLAFSLALAPALRAADIVKADNTTSLNQPGSWTGGTVPTAADRILVDATFTAPRNASLGASLSVAGIRIADPAAKANFQINSSGSAVLSLGAGGIDLDAATANLALNAPVALAANQTWVIGKGRALQFAANATFDDAGFTATVSGAGTLDYRAGTSTFASPLGMATLGVNNAAAFLRLTHAANSFGALNIFSGRVLVSGLGDHGVPSPAGTGGKNLAITLGGKDMSGIFEYNGDTASSNRAVSRDGRAPASGLEVSKSGQTLTLSANLNTTQVNAATNGWVFGGAGNLVLKGVVAKAATSGTPVTVTKNGNGVLTLAGANTYDGATTVNAGVLFVTGKLASGGAVTVNSGAALGGTGGIGAATTIASGGTLAPGKGLSLSGGLTLAPGSALVISAAAGWDLAKAGSLVVYQAASQSGAFSSVTVAVAGKPALALAKDGAVWTGKSPAGLGYRFDPATNTLTVAKAR
jgi:autotransporter-associated beta strand protein